jgi:hypothetical protein
VGKRQTDGYAISRGKLTPIREVRIGPDGEWLDRHASAAHDVSPVARIQSALGVARAAVWFGVKVIVGLAAAAFILIFAAAIVAAMFAKGSSFPIGR